MKCHRTGLTFSVSVCEPAIHVHHFVYDGSCKGCIVIWVCVLVPCFDLSSEALVQSIGVLQPRRHGSLGTQDDTDELGLGTSYCLTGKEGLANKSVIWISTRVLLESAYDMC